MFQFRIKQGLGVRGERLWHGFFFFTICVDEEDSRGSPPPRCCLWHSCSHQESTEKNKVKQSSVVLLGIFPNELNAYVHTKTCTRIFIETLFIIVKTWKQPRCPSGREWINKHQDNGMLFSVKKKSAVKPWKDVEGSYMPITRWKKSVCKGHFLCDYSFVPFWKRQNCGDSKRISGCRGLGGIKGWIDRAQEIF